METTNHGSVSLGTTVNLTLLRCAGEALLAAMLFSVMVTATLTQDSLGLVGGRPRNKGDHHASCPSQPLDADDDDDDDDDGVNGEYGEGEDLSSEGEGNFDNNKNNAKEGSRGGAEVNGDDSDDEDEDDDDEDNQEDNDGDEDDNDDDDEDGGEEGEEEGEEEEEDEEEEALQPPKKRKK